MQEFEKAAQSQRLVRTAMTCSTDRKLRSSTYALEDFSRVSDPTGETKSNSYALIAERRLQLESEAKLKSRSLLSGLSEKKGTKQSNKREKSTGLRRCYSALSFDERDSDGRASFSQIAESIMSIKFSASKRLDSLRSRISQLRNGEDSPSTGRALKIMDPMEKTRVWAQETQAILSQKNLRSPINADSTVASKESRDILTRMSSGYASEEVNQVASAKQGEEVASEICQIERQNDVIPHMPLSLMPVSTVGKQIRPRLRKSVQTRPNRSRTVHWSNRVPYGANVDARAAIDDLTSTQWERQFSALQYLGRFFNSDSSAECHEIRGWTSDCIQQLCNGLVNAATNLRSQVARMAILNIKSAVRLLTPPQLEPLTRALFFGLVVRVGGDASTAFLRTAASEAIEELVERAPAPAVIICLNDACHSAPARSLAGRRCLVRCYAASLPRLLMPNTCPAKSGRPSALSRKYQDTLNRALPNIATFLRDGDFETRKTGLLAKGDLIICRNTGKKILRMLLTIRDFEAHLKVVLTDHDRNTFMEALDKPSNSRLKNDSRINGIFSTLRIPRRSTILRRCSPKARGSSQPPPSGRDPSCPSRPCGLPLPESSPCLPQQQSPRISEVISDRKVSWQERLFSLLELSAQLVKPVAHNDLSTTELVNTVSKMLQDENEKVTATALKLCLDAGQLDSRSIRCKPSEDKFCPGLLSLLCEKEDTEGFTNVLALIYQLINNPADGISNLSRKCLDETRRILGAEALVKPVLLAIKSNPASNSANLVQELCDLTADLDADSPLIGRYLLPAAAHLLRRLPVQEKDFKDTESKAILTFAKCLVNLVGEEALYDAMASEGLTEDGLTMDPSHLLVTS
ncbi:hypothetical protein Aperf_G00000034741 [Anoplocephala perfoliata]